MAPNSYIRRALPLSRAIPSRLALASLVVAAQPEAASFGIACGASSLAGCRCLLSVIPIPCGAWALSPEARAGCGEPLVRIRGGVVRNHDPYSEYAALNQDRSTIDNDCLPSAESFLHQE